ncbi:MULTISPECIES: DUF899 family protein [Micromonospora]|uniref:DUF899 domain-containing protein n=1 Tax=Micromonospora sicca TaxID=2202420 RepID=A0A317DLF8_9ACTN|nr:MULTISPECIES: DUF899 family protein [unclassified Micromonospora]MBM0225274.1 DUF899 family protein [Micromonospora sp. ATA51]PWR15222.1 hypothetical protein DKT69_12270 [Micromonospora sp. 4G51]
MEKPRIVTAEECQRERDELLKAEKEATRALDALAARRRRLPMVKFDHGYAFESPTGRKRLLDFFEGRRQLGEAVGRREDDDRPLSLMISSG